MTLPLPHAWHQHRGFAKKRRKRRTAKLPSRLKDSTALPRPGDLPPGLWDTFSPETKVAIRMFENVGVHQGYVPIRNGTIGRKLLKRILRTLDGK
jgi:hypothetical protein